MQHATTKELNNPGRLPSMLAGHSFSLAEQSLPTSRYTFFMQEGRLRNYLITRSHFLRPGENVRTDVRCRRPQVLQNDQLPIVLLLERSATSSGCDTVGAGTSSARWRPIGHERMIQSAVTDTSTAKWFCTGVMVLATASLDLQSSQNNVPNLRMGRRYELSLLWKSRLSLDLATARSNSTAQMHARRRAAGQPREFVDFDVDVLWLTEGQAGGGAPMTSNRSVLSKTPTASSTRPQPS